MQTTPLDIANVSGNLVSIQGNLASRQVVFGFALVGPNGSPMGQIQVGVGAEAQEENAMQNAIPGFDDMLASNTKAQALFAAIQEFGLELADQYSKVINLPETA